MASTSARATHPSPGTAQASSRAPSRPPAVRKPAAGRRPARRPPGTQAWPACPHPRTKITVRAFVSLMCHDHPEWTLNNHDTQDRNRTPAVRPITERNTWSTASSRGATCTGRTAAALPYEQKDAHHHRRLRKPYARSGKNACRNDPMPFTTGNEKGQLSWPFTKSG